MIKLNQYLNERIVFALITILTIIPIFIYPYYTLDGPAHLQNAKLIVELISGESYFSDLVRFNHIVVPNWSGHFLLSLLYLIFPPILSEKIFLALVVIGFTLFFRFLIKAYNGNILASYFIFPFSYSFTFLLGFYNFSLGLVFLFFFLALYKKKKEAFSPKIIAILSFSLLLIYLSHAFVLILAFLILFIDFLFDVIYKRNWLLTLKKNLIISSIPLILLIIYVLNQPASNYNFLSNEELKYWIKTIRSIVVFSFDEEVKYTEKLFYSLFFLFSISVYKRAKQIFESFNEQKISIVTFFDALFVVVFILYFVFPDSNQFAGFFSVRLNLILFLILILWLAQQKLENWLYVSLLPIILFAHFNLIGYYNSYYENQKPILSEITYIGKKIIPNNSIVYKNYNDDNWFNGHIHHYLGMYKNNIFIVPDYEIESNYFPLIKKEKYFMIKGISVNEIINISNQNLIPDHNIIVIVSKDFSAENNFTNVFKLLYKGSFFKVYGKTV